MASDDSSTATPRTAARALANPGEPTTYYSRSGPLGDVMSALNPTSTAVIGLGTGTIAAYGEPGDSMAFYEIDPEIVSMAEGIWLASFTYLRDSRAAVSTVVGDGRLRLKEAPDGAYDLIVLDAFSSDAVPVHLLTQEAFDLYASKLSPGGTIMVHVSNRYLDLEPRRGGLGGPPGLDDVGEAGHRGCAAGRRLHLGDGVGQNAEQHGSAAGPARVAAGGPGSAQLDRRPRVGAGGPASRPDPAAPHCVGLHEPEVFSLGRWFTKAPCG